MKSNPVIDSLRRVAVGRRHDRAGLHLEVLDAGGDLAVARRRLVLDERAELFGCAALHDLLPHLPQELWLCLQLRSRLDLLWLECVGDAFASHSSWTLKSLSVMRCLMLGPALISVIVVDSLEMVWAVCQVRALLV